MLARVDTSKPTTRNAVARDRNRPFQKTERRSYWAVSFPNIVDLRKALMVAHSLNPYYGLGSDGES